LITIIVIVGCGSSKESEVEGNKEDEVLEKEEVKDQESKKEESNDENNSEGDKGDTQNSKDENENNNDKKESNDRDDTNKDEVNSNKDTSNNKENNDKNGSSTSSKPSITTKEITKTESISYKTIKENDSTLEKGKEKVKRNGSNEVRTITYKVTYKDGKETSRSRISSEVTRNPVNKIISVGTKVAGLDKPSGRDYQMESYLKSQYAVGKGKYQTLNKEKVPIFNSY
jgi:hypothetical protein